MSQELLGSLSTERMVKGAQRILIETGWLAGWVTHDSLLFLRVNTRWLGSGFLGTHSLGLRKTAELERGKDLKQEWREGSMLL